MSPPCWSSSIGPPSLPVLWLAGGLTIGALFVLGHDAAHGALFRNPRLAYWTAQLALLPSLHAYEVWVLGHNRVHHGHTGRAGIDFVWHPLTPEQYARLGRLGRLLHRVEWSAWGAGLYYLRVMWWQRMMRIAPPPRLRGAFRRDRRRVWAYLALATAALLWIGWIRTGSAGGALWIWLRALVVPWLVWNWLIGATVHIHHIGPDLAWETRSRGRGSVAPLDGATSHVIPGWLNVFWHNIFLHAAHHLDPRIPFYRLPLATAALARESDWHDARAAPAPARLARSDPALQALRLRTRSLDRLRGHAIGNPRRRALAAGRREPRAPGQAAQRHGTRRSAFSPRIARSARAPRPSRRMPPADSAIVRVVFGQSLPKSRRSWWASRRSSGIG